MSRSLRAAVTISSHVSYIVWMGQQGSYVSLSNEKSFNVEIHTKHELSIQEKQLFEFTWVLTHD